MQWYNNTTVTLQNSHGRLVIPEGYSAILAHDAQRMDEIINGKMSANEAPSEAAVFSSDLKAETDFDFVQAGYVSEDDWETLNPTELLKSVSDVTEEHNKERRAEGLAEMHVVKWLHQPVYDKSSHTAFWAIEATDSKGGNVANSTALRLGRAGFERLTLITDTRDYTPVGSPLDLMLRAFSFSAGDTYEEHLSTDKAAGYGIAALVGAVVGAKVVKIAAAGGLALFFKPILAFLALLVLGPFLWLTSIIRKFRGRKPQQPKPQSQPDDETKAAFANAIAALLDVQLTPLPPEDKRIEDQQGNIFRKSIGYVYGFIDAFLRTRG